MSLETLLSDQLSHLGIAYADWIFLGTVMPMVLFFVSEFRIGAILTFFTLGFELILFYTWGLETIKVLTMFFASLVILVLSLYITYSKKQGGLA